jgi:hypothetical protein
MTPTDPVADDELILRHIPGGPSWQAPPDDRISSFNFLLRPGETGISVSRALLTQPAQMMARLGDPASGSKIAVARAGDIRLLGLEVVPVSLDDDPGHAEIRPASASPTAKSVRRKLAELFQYIP